MKATALFLSIAPLRRPASSLRGRRALGAIVIWPLVLCFLLAFPSESLAQELSQLKNRFRANSFIQSDANGVTSGAIGANPASAIWELEPVAGTAFVRLRNTALGDHYIHTENGPVELGAAPAGWWSSQWAFERVANTNFVRFRNRHRADQYLHLEEGPLKSSAVPAGYWTSHWEIIKAAPVVSAAERQRQAELERQRAAFLRLFGDDQFVRISAGSFRMGSASVEVARPVHTVRISRSFQMGKYEVTQGQFRAFVEATGYRTEAEKSDGCQVSGYGGTRTLKAGASWKNTFEGDDRPVVCVSWNDAQAFVQWLNEQEGPARYRLPTGAEWEYAARAGTTGDHAGNFAAMSWNQSNSGRKTHVVGKKRPNAWGLYDMYGNAYEWVEDWYGVYPTGSVTDPTGPPSGSARVIRGGSWDSTHLHAQSAYRGRLKPVRRNDRLGFRLVRTGL